MNHDSLKKYRRNLHPNLELAESAFFAANRNLIVIVMAVDVLVSQKHPPGLRAGHLARPKDKQYYGTHK
jgi:hypothetical protein